MLSHTCADIGQGRATACSGHSKSQAALSHLVVVKASRGVLWLRRAVDQGPVGHAEMYNFLLSPPDDLLSGSPSTWRPASSVAWTRVVHGPGRCGHRNQQGAKGRDVRSQSIFPHLAQGSSTHCSDPGSVWKQAFAKTSKAMGDSAIMNC